MTTKRNIGLSAAFALASGAAMAAPPAGFSYNDFTVADGEITPGACPVGYTCETVMSDPGFLQQRITDGSSSAFFRTIVLEEDADGAVENLDFRLDTFAGAAAGGGPNGNVAALGRVSLSGDSGSGTLDSEISQGDWNIGEPELHIDQFQNIDTARDDRSISFSYEDVGDGTSMRMDQINPIGNQYSGPMTVRRTTGSLTVCDTGTGCILELPDGQQLTYDSGDSIAVLYQHQALFGMGNVGTENRVFENQRFTVGGNSIVWTNATNHMADGGSGAVDLGNGAVIGGVTFNTVNVDGGAWDYWDANFGTAPAGVEPPDAIPANPFDP